MQQNTRDILYIGPVMRRNHFQLQWEGKDLGSGLQDCKCALPKDPYLQPSAAAPLLLREGMGHFPVLHCHCVRK